MAHIFMQRRLIVDSRTPDRKCQFAISSPATRNKIPFKSERYTEQDAWSAAQSEAARRCPAMCRWNGRPSSLATPTMARKHYGRASDSGLTRNARNAKAPLEPEFCGAFSVLFGGEIVPLFRFQRKPTKTTRPALQPRYHAACSLRSFTECHQDPTEATGKGVGQGVGQN